MQEAISDGNRDLRRSSLLWHLYQRKAAEARTLRPWKVRLFALGQPLGESQARDTSTEKERKKERKKEKRNLSKKRKRHTKTTH